MRKKLIDTNIFIDRFADPDRFADIFTAEGTVYLSSVVLMELRAGAHLPSAIKAVDAIESFFRGVSRIITPQHIDFRMAGEILAKLQREKGYELKKTASLANDCLIATSARNLGATVVTQNARDFVAISEVFKLEIQIVKVEM
jgi:predicted nucleic acid-binding protein